MTNVEKELDNERLITVKEASALLGKSTQAIYQRIGKDLESFCVVDNGVKKVKISILQAITPGFDMGIVNNLDKQESEIDNSRDELVSVLKDTLADYRLQIDRINCQLIEKDLQIAEKDRQLSSASERLKTEQELHKNAQLLLGNLQDPSLITAKSEDQALVVKIESAVQEQELPWYKKIFTKKPRST